MLEFRISHYGCLIHKYHQILLKYDEAARWVTKQSPISVALTMFTASDTHFISQNSKLHATVQAIVGLCMINLIVIVILVSC